MDALTVPPPARQHLAGGAAAPRHRHAHPYAALVLDGGYVEAGDSGRRAVAPGEVILHGPFEAHANRFGRSGATVLNLPLPPGWRATSAFMRIRDPDTVVREAERDAVEAAGLLIGQLEPTPALPTDWRDDLAAVLSEDVPPGLTDWARAVGLAPATVSRGFRDAFGVTPHRFRAEARARAAWQRLAEPTPLALLAVDAGFADQAHMTRAIVALTGRAPGAWRRSNGFKIAASAGR